MREREKTSLLISWLLFVVVFVVAIDFLTNDLFPFFVCVCNLYR
jgi:hypothetical protein